MFRDGVWKTEVALVPICREKYGQFTGPDPIRGSTMAWYYSKN